MRSPKPTSNLWSRHIYVYMYIYIYIYIYIIHICTHIYICICIYIYIYISRGCLPGLLAFERTALVTNDVGRRINMISTSRPLAECVLMHGMQVRTHGRTDARTHARTHSCMGCMDVWMYEIMDVWTYGRMDVWMYGTHPARRAS